MKQKNLIIISLLIILVVPITLNVKALENSNESLESTILETDIKRDSQSTEIIREEMPSNISLKSQVSNGWFIEGNNKYYLENGNRVKGFKEIGGKTYFFSNVNSALKYGLQSINGNLFYLNNQGEVVNGWQQIDGETYYFENNFAVKGFKEISGKTYFFSNITSILKYGLQGIDGNLFYLNNHGEVVNGWQQIDGETYYFENNFAVKGFKEIEGKTYFFSNVTSTLKHGWQGIDGNLFYLNNQGEVVNGWQQIDGETYYFENNFAVKGFKEIDGKKYFFSNVTSTLKYGWQGINGNLFYLNNQGEVVNDWQKIDGETYYFENDFAVKGFKEIDGKKYFFSNVTSTLKYGLQGIDGNLFYLNNQGEVVNGWQKIDGETYYFENDFAVKGFKEIDGKKYFFSNVTSTLKHGWQSVSGNLFYLTMEGIVVVGSQNIEGRDYIFDDQGFLQGFKVINNQRYYYNPDGTLARGVQRLAGSYYKFDEITGAFEKFVNQKIVIDVSKHNGMIDWNAVKNSGMVDAVILRVGFGSYSLDSMFLRNVSELNRLGIPYTIYLFSYAENANEALSEANFVVNTLQKYREVRLQTSLFPIFYDIEAWTIKNQSSSDGISVDTYGNIITTFIRQVESRLGIKTRVYSYKHYIEQKLPQSVWPYVTWVAQWNDTCTYQGSYNGWQYTNSGSVPGINGRVDMSIFYY